MLRYALAALAAATLCAPVSAGTNIKGPPIEMRPEIAREARVDVIRMSSDWIEAKEDFADTFQWQVGGYLNRCAKGMRKLTLRTHIYDLSKEDAVGRLFERGEHNMAAVAEFVDRKSKQVVGRYYFDLRVDSGGFLKALVAEPELMLSEAYGKIICAAAFPAPSAKATHQLR